RLGSSVPMKLRTISGQRRVWPYGMAGGCPGELGRNRVERAAGSTGELAGCGSTHVEPGDTLVIETPGGGGYGPASTSARRRR
ncbi:hydantoinase B/oxoprolinase family protein, partial [Mycobacterium tuberculosis]|uniref:hydantoinase B/oxoprolinase family protein n=1 Tax=Mycobacterium tuberculosis TaxID=1773 RepID=UPI0032B57877